jgi:hypothetical protein
MQLANAHNAGADHDGGCNVIVQERSVQVAFGPVVYTVAFSGPRSRDKMLADSLIFKFMHLIN